MSCINVWISKPLTLSLRNCVRLLMAPEKAVRGIFYSGRSASLEPWLHTEQDIRRSYVNQVDCIGLECMGTNHS
jgi:hypothetical protein